MPDLADALAALGAGLVVGVPTDTVYGIAADPMQEAAVGRLFTAKGRALDKPIAILAANVEDARRIGVVEGDVAVAAARHWPGPLTLVVPVNEGLPPWIGDPVTRTVGVRSMIA